MRYRNILATLMSCSSDAAAFSAAQAIAAQMQATLTALLIEVKRPPLYTLEGATMELAFGEILEAEHREFERDLNDLKALAAQASQPIEVAAISAIPERLAATIGERSRYSDLTVMLRPRYSERDYYRTPIFEGVLFGSGHPLLLVPPSWKEDSIGKRIVVAWNGSREAARSLWDAAPLLENADNIDILSVGVGAGAPGFDLSSAHHAAAYLARTGVTRVNVRGRDPDMDEDSRAIIEEAQAQKADLIVMGGYGHARLMEIILGGVTRDMIESCPIPILMSH